jgi:catechol 2,3-dioxygenase
MTNATTQLANLPQPTYDEPVERARPILHHVQLKTARLDAMIEWYTDAVGLVLTYRAEQAAWLTNDEANHRLALLATPGLTDDPDKVEHVGLHHSAWEFADLDGLLETYVHFREKEELPHRTVNHGPTTSFYYLDPDGNSVELQVDNYGDWRHSIEFFRGPEFAADPFGPGVDPEALLTERAKGIDAAELARRSYAGDFPPARPNDRRIPDSGRA